MMRESIFELVTHKFDNLLAFLSGDVLTTIFSVYFLDGIDWLHPFLKITMALCVGFAGGFAGLVGKDVYTWCKKKIF